jgi:anti-anti-sigma regulatory factor
LSGVALDDDRLAILAQGMPGEQAFDADLVRGIEVLRHMPLAVILADRSGALLMQNPACFKAFGTSSSLLPWFADPEVGSALTSAVGAGEVFHAEALMRTASGERWHAIEARPTRDPVTGDAAILMFQLDVTARREAESTAHAKGRLAADLSSALSLAERQRSEILALSAPILGVGERTLVLPLIGALDEERSALIAQRLLSAVSARGARCVILDLTGVSALDGPAAARLVRLARAVELLGAIPLLTGVTPPLARALADAGVDTGDLAFMGDLRQGVEASRAIEIEGGGSARGRGLDR